jgi:hypothetical protein
MRNIGTATLLSMSRFFFFSFKKRGWRFSLSRCLVASLPRRPSNFRCIAAPYPFPADPPGIGALGPAKCKVPHALLRTILTISCDSIVAHFFFHTIHNSAPITPMTDVGRLGYSPPRVPGAWRKIDRNVGRKSSSFHRPGPGPGPGCIVTEPFTPERTEVGMHRTRIHWTRDVPYVHTTYVVVVLTVSLTLNPFEVIHTYMEGDKLATLAK